MIPHHHKHPSISTWLALIVFTGILLASVWYIVNDVAELRSEGYFHTSRHYIRRSSPDQVRSWMTFNYINKLFNLPPAYLKSQLNITAEKYPNISISTLASQQKQSSATVVEKVQTAIRSYLETKPIK